MPEWYQRPPTDSPEIFDSKNQRGGRSALKAGFDTRPRNGGSNASVNVLMGSGEW